MLAAEAPAGAGGREAKRSRPPCRRGPGLNPSVQDASSSAEIGGEVRTGATRSKV